MIWLHYMVVSKSTKTDFEAASILLRITKTTSY